MKEEIQGSLEWLSNLIVKHGFFIMFLLLGWFCFKYLWFWIVMPILFILFIKQMSFVFGWQVWQVLDVKLIIASWIFVFTLFKK